MIEKYRPLRRLFDEEFQCLYCVATGLMEDHRGKILAILEFAYQEISNLVSLESKPEGWRLSNYLAQLAEELRYRLTQALLEANGFDPSLEGMKEFTEARGYRPYFDVFYLWQLETPKFYLVIDLLHGLGKRDPYTRDSVFPQLDFSYH